MRLTKMKRLGVLCGAVVLSAAYAHAAIDTFMTIDGPGFKGAGEQIRLANVSHTATAPRDAATGLASGRRMYSPVVITKQVDSASPKLMQAMQKGAGLGQVTIQYGSGGGAGKVKAVQTVVLKDARIASIRNNGTTETITLTYAQIEVTWTDGGKTATDDWETR